MIKSITDILQGITILILIFGDWATQRRIDKIEDELRKVGK